MIIIKMVILNFLKIQDGYNLKLSKTNSLVFVIIYLGGSNGKDKSYG